MVLSSTPFPLQITIENQSMLFLFLSAVTGGVVVHFPLVAVAVAPMQMLVLVQH